MPHTPLVFSLLSSQETSLAPSCLFSFSIQETLLTPFACKFFVRRCHSPQEVSFACLCKHSVKKPKPSVLVSWFCVTQQSSCKLSILWCTAVLVQLKSSLDECLQSCKWEFDSYCLLVGDFAIVTHSANNRWKVKAGHGVFVFPTTISLCVFVLCKISCNVCQLHAAACFHSCGQCHFSSILIALKCHHITVPHMMCVHMMCVMMVIASMCAILQSKRCEVILTVITLHFTGQCHPAWNSSSKDQIWKQFITWNSHAEVRGSSAVPFVGMWLACFQQCIPTIDTADKQSKKSSEKKRSALLVVVPCSHH